MSNKYVVALRNTQKPGTTPPVGFIQNDDFDICDALDDAMKFDSQEEAQATATRVNESEELQEGHEFGPENFEALLAVLAGAAPESAGEEARS